MTGYSTIAEVRRKLCFILPILKEPQTSDSEGKITLENKPIADTDGDGVYTDDVTVVKVADQTPVIVASVNNLTGEAILTGCTETAVLVTYHYEKNGHSAAVSDATIQVWIGQSKAEIDSRLKKIYNVPFQLSPNTPPEIEAVSSDLTSARILMQLYTTGSSEEHAWAKERLELAEKFLEDLGSGKAKVVSVSSLKQAVSKYEGTEPIFTMSEDTYRDRGSYLENAEGSMEEIMSGD